MALRIITSIALLLGANIALANAPTNMPPVPYLDWGACPFECCTYRDWQAIKPITAYKNRDEKAGVAFKLNKNEHVRAITGVVVTQQLGVVEVIKPVKIGYTANSQTPALSLKPGDKIYPLHYAGEGFEVFWYKGKTYSDDISYENAEAIKIHKNPNYVWWAKLKNRAGKIGWTKQTDQFNNQDSCG